MRKSPSLSRGSSVLPSLRAFGAVAAVTTGLVLASPVAAFAAPSPVTPTVACYWGNADGSTTFSVGYTNSGATTVTYPVGTLNFVSPAPADRGQPTIFLPGVHTNAWAPTVTASDLANNPNWTVNGVPVNYGGNIPACASKPVSVSGSTTGYLTATAAIVGVGAYIINKPRRRRSLSSPAKSSVPVSA